MTATYVKVSLNLGDGSGAPPLMGSVLLTASAQVADALDPLLVTQGPVQGQYGDPGQPVPVVTLLAPDSPGLPSPPIAYQAAFPGVPGRPLSYFIQPFAGPVAFTATAGDPCTFTFTPVEGGLSELPHQTEAALSGDSLPGGFTPGTYYVANPAGVTFNLTAAPGGPALAASSSGSGQLTVTRYNLSSLTPAEPADQFQGYLPEPAGSPEQGMAPLATGSGLGTQWGFPVAEGSLPAPSGTAQPGQVPVATGTGQASAWTTLTAAGTGADPAGAAAAAQAASDPSGSAAAAQGASLQKASNLSDLGNAAAARTNLGLGTAATQASTAFDAAGAAAAAQAAAIAASDPAGSAAAAAAASLPAAQSFTLANNSYKPVYEWTVSGQTLDPLPSFGLVAGSLTFGYPHTSPTETTQGPAFWWGINPRHLSNMVPSGTHSALGISAFQTAGDSYNPATGGTGMEFNVAWSSPTGAKAYAPVEIVVLDDETRTGTLALRVGDGSFTRSDGSQYVSGFTLSDAGGNGYLTAGPSANVAYGAVAAGTAPGVQIAQGTAFTNLPYLYGASPGGILANFTAQGAAGSGTISWTVASNNDSATVRWQGGTSALHTVFAAAGTAVATVQSASDLATFNLIAAGTGKAAKFQATSAAGTAQFILNGNSGTSAQMVFQKNSANTWVMADSGGAFFQLTNNSGNRQFLFQSGANVAGSYDSAVSTFPTKFVVNGSMVVNNGGSALATTATTGFLYVPSVAGTQAGTPVANAGAVPFAVDTAGGKPWFNPAGTWTALATEGFVTSAVGTETTRATTAEGTLSTAIGSEVTRATGAESSLSTAIGAEVTRAEAAEAAITGDMLATVATTGLAGYTLAASAGPILAWTAPDDGQVHTVIVSCVMSVTSAATGTSIAAAYTLPDGTADSHSILASSQSTGTKWGTFDFLAIAPGSTVTFSQSSALTAGAATLWLTLLAR